ncbi:MAG: DUF4367 domain-containing protein [Lachnospiraceae bacterium]
MERKKEADSLHSEDKKIELLLQEAFDYSDEQLLKELEMAEAQVKSAQMTEEEKSLDGQQNPIVQGANAAPSDEFQQIMEKMRERGIEPKLKTELKAAVSHPIIELDTNLRAAETSEPERPPEGEADTETDMEIIHRPHRRGRRAWGIILAAALAGTLLWATGIGVSGRKVLEYKPDIRDGKSSNIAWDNEEENYIQVDSEEEAYKVIEEKLGIPVLKIGYRPEGMKFKKLVLEKNFAFLEFEYEGKRIHLVEGQGWNETSSTISSDRNDAFKVENEWVNQALFIQVNEQTEGGIEYSMELEKDNAHYALEGVMKKEEFEKIVKDLNYN